MSNTEIIEKAEKIHANVMLKLMQPYFQWKLQYIFKSKENNE